MVYYLIWKLKVLILEHHALICGFNLEQPPQGWCLVQIHFAFTNICLDVVTNSTSAVQQKVASKLPQTESPVTK